MKIKLVKQQKGCASDTSADLMISGTVTDTLTGGTGGVTGGNVYVYEAPANGTVTTMTIDDSRDRNSGSIYVDTSQLTNAGTVIGFSGMDVTSTLTISGQSGNNIIVTGFSPGDAANDAEWRVAA